MKEGGIRHKHQNSSRSPDNPFTTPKASQTPISQILFLMKSKEQSKKEKKSSIIQATAFAFTAALFPFLPPILNAAPSSGSAGHNISITAETSASTIPNPANPSAK